MPPASVGSAFREVDRELHELERTMDALRRRPPGAAPPGRPAREGAELGPELHRLAGELERLARELSLAVGRMPGSRTEDRRGSPDRPVPGEASAP